MECNEHSFVGRNTPPLWREEKMMQEEFKFILPPKGRGLIRTVSYVPVTKPPSITHVLIKGVGKWLKSK